jgi:hypothetical protein
MLIIKETNEYKNQKFIRKIQANILKYGQDFLYRTLRITK